MTHSVLALNQPTNPYWVRMIEAMEREEAGVPEPRPQSTGTAAVAEFFPELVEDSVPWEGPVEAVCVVGSDSTEPHYAYGVVAVDVFTPPGQPPYALNSLVARPESDLSEPPIPSAVPASQQSYADIVKETPYDPLPAHAPAGRPSQLKELHVVVDQGSTGQTRALRKDQLLLTEAPTHSYTATVVQTSVSSLPLRSAGKSASRRKELAQPLKAPVHLETVDLSQSPECRSADRRRRHCDGGMKRKREVETLAIPGAYPQPKAPHSSAPLLSRGTGRVGRLHKPRALKPKVCVPSTPTTASIFSRESYQLLTPSLAQALGFLPATVPTPTANPSTRLYLAPRRY